MSIGTDNVIDQSDWAASTCTGALDACKTAISANTSAIAVNTSDIATLDAGKAPAALVSIADVTASAAAQSGWVNGLVPINAAGPVVITLNTNAFGGKNKGCVFYHKGAGALSFASGTATVRSRGNLLNSAGQYSLLSLVQLDSGGTEFVLSGDRA